MSHFCGFGCHVMLACGGISTVWRLQMMIWAVGLRGAVAYGLALNLPQIESESDEGIPAIESATLVIVVLSTLILGSATGPLLRRFDLQVTLWLC